MLTDTFERIVVDNRYSDKRLGTYILRGENIVMLGEVDPAREAQTKLQRVSVAEIEAMAAAQADSTPIGMASNPLDFTFLLDDM